MIAAASSNQIFPSTFSRYFKNVPIFRRITNNTVSFATSTPAIRSDSCFSDENRRNVIDRLKKNAASPLFVIGENKLARSDRSTDVKRNLKQAAVLVPLVDVDGIASILFTVRSNLLNSHRGEISFPGGGVDEIDGGSAEKAALREAHEEIGVDPSRIDIWGQLSPTLSRHGDTIIKPFLGHIRDGFDTGAFAQRRHGSAEVWTVFARDLNSLIDRDNLSFTQFRQGYSLPVFNAGPSYRIWGLTAIVLHSALKLLLPDSYRPVVRYTKPLI